MSKLIKQFEENPSQENKIKLIRYMKQHPMAECFATEAEMKILRKLTNGE